MTLTAFRSPLADEQLRSTISALVTPANARRLDRPPLVLRAPSPTDPDITTIATIPIGTAQRILSLQRLLIHHQLAQINDACDACHWHQTEQAPDAKRASNHVLATELDVVSVTQLYFHFEAYRNTDYMLLTSAEFPIKALTKHFRLPAGAGDDLRCSNSSLLLDRLNR